MRTENWKNVKDILTEALKLNLPERRGFLDNAPITTETRKEVESLLSVEENARDFMSVTASGFSKNFFDLDTAGEHTAAGQKIGVYRIVRELGIGGMGAVYLAERNDGKFDQQVAIKLLKREFNAGKVRQSFNREIEIQAKLVHPNIAKMLDTGTTADGIPYITMEYVEGLPIDKFCYDNSLSLIGRLKVFNKACEAVTFAHQNLIVHRDLKPSNIIVTPAGVPKLLDFGISKLLDSPEGDPTGITMMGAMTPEYASPEQIRGGSVTTATDVYSLGVILFKLLTGTYPYDLKSKFNGDVLREITDSAPILPSHAVSFREGEKGRKGDGETKVSSLGDSPSPRLPISPSQLRGDLDNIILKALAKEPERRYASVEQFSADIWRFVDGRPVMARPATFSYRASKFYLRNKISVLAAVLILMSLIAGIAVAVSQAGAARRQAEIASEARAAAELETTRARAEQQKAEKISLFMAKFISYANPRWDTEGAKSNGEAKMIDVLFGMSDRIDAEFAENADVRAELHHKFAEVFQRITKPYYKNPRRDEAGEKGMFHARRALELRRQFYGERHELVAKDLAYYYWTHKQEPADAAKMMAAAIQMMRETNPKNLNLPFMLGDYAGGLMLPNQSESVYNVKYPREEYHETYRKAAIPPTSDDKYQIGERYLREALPMMRAQFAEDNYAIFVTECYLAYSLAMQDKWTDFDAPYQICKQGETKVQDKHSVVGMRTVIGWVKRALAEKKRPSFE